MVVPSQSGALLTWLYSGESYAHEITWLLPANQIRWPVTPSVIAHIRDLARLSPIPPERLGYLGELQITPILSVVTPYELSYDICPRDLSNFLTHQTFPHSLPSPFKKKESTKKSRNFSYYRLLATPTPLCFYYHPLNQHPHIPNHTNPVTR